MYFSLNFLAINIIIIIITHSASLYENCCILTISQTSLKLGQPTNQTAVLVLFRKRKIISLKK